MGKIKLILGAFILLFGSTSIHAGVIWDESIHGDIGFGADSATFLGTIAAGVYTALGTSSLENDGIFGTITDREHFFSLYLTLR